MDSVRTIGSVFRRSDDVESIADGAILFREGDAGDCMFVVREGLVDLSIAGEVVETMGPDGVFGELALVDAGPRSATATARGRCSVVRVTPERFLFLVQQHPYFALEVMRLLAQRLRIMNQRAGIREAR